MADYYLEGFGTIPCSLCGHGDCQCKDELELLITKKRKPRRIVDD